MPSEIVTELEIDAPPSLVWRVLCDFDAYPEWNPFVLSMRAKLTEGAKAMARFRPEARLGGLAPEVATARALSMVWGVAPLQVEQYDTTDEMVWFAVERAMEHGYVGHGDTVVVLVGSPALRPDDGPRRWRPDGVATDVLRIVTLD